MRTALWIALCGVLAFTVGFAGSGTAERWDRAGKDRAYLYHHIEPNVVYKGDVGTTLKVEVGTIGQGVAGVRLSLPVEAAMYDDGSHGDEVPGDGVYTLEGVEHRTQYGRLGFGGTHTTSGHVRAVIDRTDGTHEECSLGMGIVDPGQRFTAQRVADGLYATEYALFMVDPFGQVFNAPQWPLAEFTCGTAHVGVTEKLYSVYSDRFDYVIVMPADNLFDPTRNYAENVPYFVRAKNSVGRIGIERFDNTADFGSAGRLAGMIYHSWGYGSILDHELGHSWGADIGEEYGLTRCEECYGNHWNPYSDIGGQMAAFIFHPDAQYGAGHLMDNGDGTWRIEREPADNCPYSMLDLYVMGLVPPEDVPPIHVLVNPDTSDADRVTAESVETYTIEDVMALEGGERVPPHELAPKTFNVAFVVVGDREFTAAEYAYYSLVSRYFASKDKGELSLTTFYAATGGRATLDARIPRHPRRSAGRVSPP